MNKQERYEAIRRAKTEAREEIDPVKAQAIMDAALRPKASDGSDDTPGTPATAPKPQIPFATFRPDRAAAEEPKPKAKKPAAPKKHASKKVPIAAFKEASDAKRKAMAETVEPFALPKLKPVGRKAK